MRLRTKLIAAAVVAGAVGLFSAPGSASAAPALAVTVGKLSAGPVQAEPVHYRHRKRHRLKRRGGPRRYRYRYPYAYYYYGPRYYGPRYYAPRSYHRPRPRFRYRSPRFGFYIY